MDLGYLIQLDPIYRSLCEYLRTEDRLTLQNVSKDFRSLVSSSPNTWKRLDLTGKSKDVILWILDNDAVPGALQELVVDCTDISEMTITVILMRCPHIRRLGIGGCTEMFEGLLNAVKLLKTNGQAPKLEFLGLLGAPHFKTAGVNGIAASVVKDFTTLGITTDLERCTQVHAFQSDPEDQWHLKVPQSSTCTTCERDSSGCQPCMSSRTCRGCFKHWCFDCESPITRVCYECGYSCNHCKQGVYVKCTECSSMFCTIHREDDSHLVPTEFAASGRTQTSTSTRSTFKDNICDWCIQGRYQGFLAPNQ